MSNIIHFLLKKWEATYRNSKKEIELSRVLNKMTKEQRYNIPLSFNESTKKEVEYE